MRAALLMVPVLLGGAACRRESAEAQVHRAFRACVDAVESGDPEPVLERLAKDFQGPEGMDREGAKLFLLGLLRREKVGVTVLEERTEAAGDAGMQEVVVVLTSRGEGALMPQDASRRRFTLRWVRQGGQWRLKEMRESA